MIEERVGKLLDQQEQSAQMQTQTVETLHRLNQTFQFLLRVSESSRDQLNWIQSLVVNTGIYIIEFWGGCQVFNAFFKKSFPFWKFRKKGRQTLDVDSSRVLFSDRNAPIGIRSSAVVHPLDIFSPGSYQFDDGSSARRCHGCAGSCDAPFHVFIR